MNELINNTVKMVNLERIKTLFSLMRISHWSKAGFVMAGFIYSPAKGYFFPAIFAALSFCLISSAISIYNDIEDKSSDSLNPARPKGPIACDQVRVGDAIFLLFFLLFAGLCLGWMVSKNLVLILTIFLVLNIAYTHVLKLMPIFDVVCIAMGFILRVLAGTLGIGLPISLWLVISSIVLSLFIALNKLQLELHMGEGHTRREVLRKYDPHLLQLAIFITGIVCFGMYFLYTVFVRSDESLLLLTIPFSAFALWRFAWLSTQDLKEDDLVTVFINDPLSCLNLLCFVLLTYMSLGF